MADSSVFFCHLGARWISLVLNWLLGLLTLFSEKLANFQIDRPAMERPSDTTGPFTDNYGVDGGLVLEKRLRSKLGDDAYNEEVASMWHELTEASRSMPAHASISSFLAAHVEPGELPSIKTVFFANGPIVHYNKKCIGIDKLKQIIRIAEGLVFLHEQGISHGNLSPSNILIKNDGNPCITDAGLHHRMRQLTYTDREPVPVTWRYKSPEVLENSAIVSSDADTYAYACVVYEVFTGEQPYHTLNSYQGVVRIVRNGHRALSIPSEISQDLWIILQKCWALSPAARPSMQDVLVAVRGLRR